MLLKHFTEAELVPEIWMAHAGGGAVNVFDPAILRLPDGTTSAELIMAYRVVLPDGSRHIAICRLRNDWSVRAGSIVPLSDVLIYADVGSADPELHARPADPRLVLLHGRLFMHFNSGAIPEPNRIYLVELDSATLRPLAPARPVIRRGTRRNIEKNWMFFEDGEDLYVIYALSPLTILRVDLSDAKQVVCDDAFVHAWESWPYEDSYGELRGGATPVRHDGQLLIVAHSQFPGEADETRPHFEALCSVGAILSLSDRPPFAPLLYSPRPVLELDPREHMLPQLPKLDARVQEALYPCGAVADPSGMTVSYGVNNRHAALRRIPWRDLQDSLIPVVRRGAQRNGQPSAAHNEGVPKQPSHRESADVSVQAGATTSFPGTDDCSLRAVWWRPPPLNPRSPRRVDGIAKEEFIYGNFGDMFVPHLLHRLTGIQPTNLAEGPRLLSLGSLIHTAREGDMIWGTGVKGGPSEMAHLPRHLRVKATRGPISREFLRRRGYDVTRADVMFDPAALLPHLFSSEIAALRARVGNPTKDFILIPHFRDDAVMRRLYPKHAKRIISVDTPFFEMVAQILRADLVVSSSLHGLIVAEALGIPAVWHRPLMGEDELKFHDYYLGTDRYRIVRADTLHDALKAYPMPLPAFDPAAMLATFPTFAELDACGLLIHPPSPLPIARLVPLNTRQLAGLSLLKGWSAPEPHGVWSIDTIAELEFSVGHDANNDHILELFLVGFVPRPGLSQRFNLTDQVNDLGTYELTDQKPKVLRLNLRDLARNDGRIRLLFSIPTAASPASLGLNQDDRHLGLALNAIRLRPAQLPLTDDANLRIDVGGQSYAATEHEADRHVFDLPAIDGPVRIVSRVSGYEDRPDSEPGLTDSDRRQLGVTVESIVVTIGDVATTIEAGDGRLDQGWWPLEQQEGRSWRWTNGSALLPLAPSSGARIEIRGVRSCSYPLVVPHADHYTQAIPNEVFQSII